MFLNFWRCTSVLIRRLSLSASTHITWVWGWPSGKSVVSAAKFFPRASSTTFGWRSWSFVFSATHLPPPSNVHQDEESLRAVIINSRCASRPDRRYCLHVVGGSITHRIGGPSALSPWRPLPP